MVRENDDSYRFGLIYPAIFSPTGRARRFSGESEICVSGGRVSVPVFSSCMVTFPVLPGDGDAGLNDIPMSTMFTGGEDEREESNGVLGFSLLGSV